MSNRGTGVTMDPGSLPFSAKSKIWEKFVSGKSLVCFAAALVLAFLATLPAGAAERIHDYRSEIIVQNDGGLLVTETIEVTAEGRNIKRGIYRDFPTIYKTDDGRSTTTFAIQSVKRDGIREDYHTEERSNGIRLYIGNANVMVSHGRHVYEITYLTYRQLRHFDDFDELYWNVTGNGWMFPIDRASAAIRLPPGADILASDAFTGEQGDTGKNFTETVEPGFSIGFQTTQPLGAEEGITASIAWPLGFVDRPNAAEELEWFLTDNLPLLIGLIGALLALGYYSIVWLMVGRDPGKGTIIARFKSPEGMSPAAVRQVMEFGTDR
ncbi:MAG: DUF2207 domain-containing protein, partial [Proteobacteria bacterium]|nr:DUF2207 domain-containing protein [Pseudomonadota bacterium]